jgi:lipopolysaccharide/colanic/teichoic acid biosynthesis glycosyltransferase
MRPKRSYGSDKSKKMGEEEGVRNNADSSYKRSNELTAYHLDSSSSVMDEETFNRILALERKRTERSKRPFILMLLSVSEDGNGLIEQTLSCLADTKRDIDVLGWYKANHVIGIIFTEISDSKHEPVVDCIVRRVKTNLSFGLTSEEMKKIGISIYSFPEKDNGPGCSEKDNDTGRPVDLTLYPDLTQTSFSHKISLILKRCIDVIGSIAALVACAPVFVLISGLIKLTSEGPVFFRQKRVGQYGESFTFLKFRSMYANNDPAIHQEYVKDLICSRESKPVNGASEKQQVFKIQNDPRVTPVGRFLRKMSLDELPQFINVLKGEMSLVGPRPPIPYELENYDIWHKRRILDMKPGITGLWQVEGRSRTNFNDMVRLDIQYMTNWSIWLDLKLLFKTPLAVFTSKGAY